MQKYISNLNLPLYLLFVGVTSTLLAGQSGDFVWLFVFLASALSIQGWMLAHESVHGVLFRNPTMNMVGGRILFIIFGSPFDFMRVMHFLHHKHNRSEVDRMEVYDKSTENSLFRFVGYYFSLLGGTVFSQILLPFIFLLPSAWSKQVLVWIVRNKSKPFHAVVSEMSRHLLRKQALGRMRTDLLAIVILYSSVVYFGYRMYQPLLAYFLMRSFLLSVLDNLYDYGTPVGISYNLNLSLIRPVSYFMLYHNYHRLHHRYPRVPWHELPVLFNKDEDYFDRGYLSQVFFQFRGPLQVNHLNALPEKSGIGNTR